MSGRLLLQNKQYIFGVEISQLYHILSGGSTPRTPRIGGYSPKPPFNPYQHSGPFHMKIFNVAVVNLKLIFENQKCIFGIEISELYQIFSGGSTPAPPIGGVLPQIPVQHVPW